MKRIFAAMLGCLALVSIGNAAVVTVSNTPSGSAPTYTFSETGLMDGGLTFDVIYTISGSADVSATSGFGLGVLGGAADAVEAGESLTITGVINITSGTGTVAGTFDAATTLGTANGTIGSLPSSFPAVTLTGAVGDTFFLQSFTTSFVGTPAAVPEPGSFACLGFLAMGLVTRRRRRRKA
jgi:hypothetical protein